MNAVITWRGGQKTIENADLGDPRIDEHLSHLAALRRQGVCLTFVEAERKCDCGSIYSGQHGRPCPVHG